MLGSTRHWYTYRTYKRARWRLPLNVTLWLLSHTNCGGKTNYRWKRCTHHDLFHQPKLLGSSSLSSAQKQPLQNDSIFPEQELVTNLKDHSKSLRLSTMMLAVAEWWSLPGEARSNPVMRQSSGWFSFIPSHDAGKQLEASDVLRETLYHRTSPTTEDRGQFHPRIILEKP